MGVTLLRLSLVYYPYLSPLSTLFLLFSLFLLSTLLVYSVSAAKRQELLLFSFLSGMIYIDLVCPTSLSVFHMLFFSRK